MATRQDLFLFIVSNLRNGKSQEELSEKLSKLVMKCSDTGKVGTITLKIKVVPDKSGNGQYFLRDEIDVAEPKFERGQTLMYGTPDGNLQRTDPNQQDMFPRPATGDASAFDDTPKVAKVDDAPQVSS